MSDIVFQVSQVAAGVTNLHRANIVHGDLKGVRTYNSVYYILMLIAVLFIRITSWSMMIIRRVSQISGFL
jgi:hypothetical protein